LQNDRFPRPKYSSRSRFTRALNRLDGPQIFISSIVLESSCVTAGDNLHYNKIPGTISRHQEESPNSGMFRDSLEGAILRGAVRGTFRSDAKH
jgi:hypothetical protein